ncbi:FG-GAP repeat protein [Streptomyces sp. V2I9]|uniref:FG-GAP repeat protein n=1 Tax=Streptomyces sp. V2I9 TaxID=3042304 RepID=UPI00277F5CC8|nr:FG-GAP repeat protein [Streptomyces sp. V2I9]MDQ0983210.1 hypothetical protein [Streptomyces sp. V2I9]
MTRHDGGVPKEPDNGDHAGTGAHGHSRRVAIAKKAGLLAVFALAHGRPYAAPAQAAAACAGGASVFNGDGIRDVATAAPEATVAGKKRAGLMRIVLGGGKGAVEISQESPDVADGAEAGDRFGTSLAVYDADLDGCADLAIGTPYEDVGPERDAGYVQVIFGSTEAVGRDKASKGFLQGSAYPIGGTPEQEDWFGYAVTAGKSITGNPFLVIGIPGEDIGTVPDAGTLGYIYGTDFKGTAVSQDSVGVREEAERYDRFGSSAAATDRHIAVGAPRESRGTVAGTGGLRAFAPPINTDDIPRPLFGMGQSRTPDPDTAAQTDDHYATALAMAPCRPAGAAAITDSLLAVGVPGEDLSTTVDASAVHVFHITAAGTVSLVNWIDQNTPDVGGSPEAGELSGQRLAAADTTTDVVSTSATVHLAVGVPGEDMGEFSEQGGVHNLPMIGAPGASDVWIGPGAGEPAARTYTGLSLGTSRLSSTSARRTAAGRCGPYTVLVR